MESQIDSTMEERVKSLLGQLQIERGIFERMVYKNKNQHRRSSYFQYLLKVRRDLRLLQSANLGELLSSSFHVITGKSAGRKVQLLESLKRRKCDVGKPNFKERLLGAARLLSQMVEPMLRAATEVSTLLARSFFMGFSLMILSLLARLQVLVQQLLLDVVSVVNAVSCISQKKQSVKFNQEGVEVYREYYPKEEEEYVTLECVWETDKFKLVEKTEKCEIKSEEADIGKDVSVGDTAVQYQSIESFLQDDVSSEKADASCSANEGSTDVKAKDTNPSTSPAIEGGAEPSPCKNPPSTSVTSSSSKLISGKRKVAFVSVKRPAPSAPSTTKLPDLPSKEDVNSSGDRVDHFYKLLTGGNIKDSLF
ncbi:hypothetical protein SLE2022_396020 [Rubroshorea leprosula]